MSPVRKQEWFPWFAWHPVRTSDRGWRWLIPLWRRRVTHIAPIGIPFHGGDVSYEWQQRVQRNEGDNQ